MFSKLFGKGSKPAPPGTRGAVGRGLEVVEDDPETAWGMWDSALAEQDTRFREGTGDGSRSASSVQVRTDPMAQPDFDAPTQPMALEEKSFAQRREDALAAVELHHHRIANTIRTLWGYKECSVYIDKLIMNGGDGMGQARIGFNHEAAQAMMALSDLHEAEFGHNRTEAAQSFDPTVRVGLDGRGPR